MRASPQVDSLHALIRGVLFKLEAELAHDLAMGLLGAVSSAPAITELLGRALRIGDRSLATDLCGIPLAHPLGVAAGLDKDARAVPVLAALGFAAVEVGTVTPRPQPGNPRPRLFRLPEQGALVNRMGFNSSGALAVAERLAGARPACVVGLNLGKNRTTDLDRAAEDYEAALAALDGAGSYLVVNVSSPNTPGLRDLQDERRLGELLRRVVRAERGLAAAGGRAARPTLVKLSPDLAEAALDASVEAAEAAGAAGIIATNTTLQRPAGCRGAQAGGLSGRPLRPLALRVVRRVFRRLDGRLPVVGVGGVATAEDAWQLMRAGARVVQVYTGFVYGGPGLPRRLLAGLARRARAAGLSRLSDAVGADA